MTEKRWCKKCAAITTHNLGTRAGRRPYSECAPCLSRRTRLSYLNQSPMRRERLKAASLLHKYALTHEQLEAMTIARGGACEICGRAAKLICEHSHETGTLPLAVRASERTYG